MDIVASVLAYLTCLAGIVGAFVLSVSFVFSTPKQSATAQPSTVVASASVPKPAPPADLKKPLLRGTTADNSAVNHVAPTTQKREEAPQHTAAAAQAAPIRPSTSVTAPQNSATKSKISRAQWREIVQQERRHRLAYQQDADFESRFLGYAD